MNLVQRVQDILLRPAQTWPQIEQEPDDTAGLYRHYVAILALVPAIAGFVGLSLVGMSALGMHLRVPVVSGLVSAVVGYAISLGMVFVLAWIVDRLAPSFGGQRSQVNAIKLVAYASTAGWLGGVFSLLPSLAILGALAGLYSIYLLYTGLPVLMKCPREKAVVYTVVAALCFIVGWLVVGAVSSALTPSMAPPIIPPAQ